MKLEIAASILGVPIDVDLDTLKQTYRRLALTYHPDKSSDLKAKEKFQQISIAYTKLISAHHNLNSSTSPDVTTSDPDHSDDDSTLTFDDDIQEMRAFMRMFMDVVGIFNDEYGGTEESLKHSGMSFGMVFGPTGDGSMAGEEAPNGHEEWNSESSTDDDEILDDAKRGDIITPDSTGTVEATGPVGVPWEPMAKSYVNMNLKDSIGKREAPLRISLVDDSKDDDDDDDDEENMGGSDDLNDEAEIRRKQRNAKKRAEKRRKQKEKKQQELALKEENDLKLKRAEDQAKQEQEELIQRRREELKLQQEAENQRRKMLFAHVSAGRLDEVKKLLVDQVASGLKVTERVSGGGKTGSGLLHFCVSDVSNSSDVFPELAASSQSESYVQYLKCNESQAQLRLEVAGYLLSLRSPSIDLSLMDEYGRSVLHLAALCGDSKLIELLIKQGLSTSNESSKKSYQMQPVDINARCFHLGWTPLHYSVVSGALVACQMLIDAGSILNVHAYSPQAFNGGTSSGISASSASSNPDEPGPNPTGLRYNGISGNERQGPTPLELAKFRLTEVSTSTSKAKSNALQEVFKLICDSNHKLENLKLLRDQEKLNKENKVKAERSKQLQKEQEEKELLERKQKQLKDKAEKEKQKLEEMASAIQKVSATTAAGDPNGTGGKKKKKNKDKKGDTEVPVPETTKPSLPQVSTTNTITPTSSTAGPAGVVGVVDAEVRSRDELLDHLLAMGFSMMDCLDAISACGLNADLAISWLCERPMMDKVAALSGTSTAVSQNANSAPLTSNKDLTKKNSATKLSVPSTNTNPVSSNAAGNAEHNDSKADKDKKDLQRKGINSTEKNNNRDWNAKLQQQQRAIEEKKKIEMEKQSAQSETKATIRSQMPPSFPASNFGPSSGASVRPNQSRVLDQSLSQPLSQAGGEYYDRGSFSSSDYLLHRLSSADLGVPSASKQSTVLSVAPGLGLNGNYVPSGVGQMPSRGWEFDDIINGGDDLDMLRNYDLLTDTRDVFSAPDLGGLELSAGAKPFVPTVKFNSSSLIGPPPGIKSSLSNGSVSSLIGLNDDLSTNLGGGTPSWLLSGSASSDFGELEPSNHLMWGNSDQSSRNLLGGLVNDLDLASGQFDQPMDHLDMLGFLDGDLPNLDGIVGNGVTRKAAASSRMHPLFGSSQKDLDLLGVDRKSFFGSFNEGGFFGGGNGISDDSFSFSSLEESSSNPSINGFHQNK